MDVKPQRKWLTTEQAAELMGVTKAAVAQWRLVDSGLRYYKFGGAVRYDADDVERYIDSCKVQPQFGVAKDT